MNTSFITPTFCYTAAIIGAFVTAVSQILLKKQANITSKNSDATDNCRETADSDEDGRNSRESVDSSKSVSSGCEDVGTGKSSSGGLIRSARGFLRRFMNWRVILSYSLLFMTLVVNQIALIYVPVSVMPCITATSFVWVYILGVIILKEKVSKRRMIGVAIIITGVIISRL